MRCFFIICCYHTSQFWMKINNRHKHKLLSIDWVAKRICPTRSLPRQWGSQHRRGKRREINENFNDVFVHFMRAFFHYLLFMVSICVCVSSFAGLFVCWNFYFLIPRVCKRLCMLTWLKFWWLVYVIFNVQHEFVYVCVFERGIVCVRVG